MQHLMEQKAVEPPHTRRNWVILFRCYSDPYIAKG
jgi:hypothetical protein